MCWGKPRKPNFWHFFTLSPTIQEVSDFSLNPSHLLNSSLCCSMYCFVCKCVLYFCHRVSAQLQLTNVSKTRDHAIRKSSIFIHLWTSVAHECALSNPWFISLPQHYACTQFLTLLALHFPLPKVIKRCLTSQTLQLQGTGVREERKDQHFTGWSTQEEGLGTGVWGNVVDYGKILWRRCCSSPGFLLEDSDMS